MDLKELLLKDLGARLPYGVICKSKYIEYDEIDGDDVEWDKEGKLEVVGDDYVIINSYQCELDETKPYLRSLSSMTEEEKEELKKLFDAKEVTNNSLGFIEGGTLEDYISQVSYNFCGGVTDWLLAHHFDYRFPGLIEKGLALEAPKGMY